MESVSIDQILQLVFNLSLAAPGVAALIAVLISIGKMFGFVKDGYAPLALNILNTLFALAIGVVVVFFPSVNFGGLDAFLKSLSGTLTAFLPVLAILVRWLAPQVYNAFRGFPLLGYTHTKG